VGLPDERMTESHLPALAAQIDALVQELEALPYPAVREQMFELLQAVDGLHRLALGRFVGLLREHGGSSALERAADDPVVALLLRLYDLAPDDPRQQVEAALDVVRPYMHAHGGEVELVDIVDGIVHLRLSGSCDGCPASEITLRRRVETALRDGVPGFAGIRVHEPMSAAAPVPVSGFIPLADIGPAPRATPRRPVFHAVAPLDAIPPGTLQAYDVDGVWVLVANVAGEVYAARNTCPGSMAPLHLGSFVPPVVVCPWHNEAFDVRTGKRADGQSGPSLAVVPVAVRDGQILIAAAVAEAGVA
jgi:Fe-S cluster biogenesis protein NfuA/nitrite reductase/ring-hydroxylating ferredoxin subunit